MIARLWHINKFHSEENINRDKKNRIRLSDKNQIVSQHLKNKKTPCKNNRAQKQEPNRN